MSSQQLSTFRVQLDFFCCTDINLSEIILVEISAFQHITTLKKNQGFKLGFCYVNKP